MINIVRLAMGFASAAAILLLPVLYDRYFTFFEIPKTPGNETVVVMALLLIATLLLAFSVSNFWLMDSKNNYKKL